MRITTWINENPTSATVLAVALLVVTSTILLWQVRGPTYEPRDVYFWDLEEEAPFPYRFDAIPPVTAPSGGPGVRANLYTCGECTPEEWFGYLETYSERAKQAYKERGVDPEEIEPLRVRDLRGGQWAADDSDHAHHIFTAVDARCESPTLCLP